jgi:ABC-type Zn2+ transport system substrate-binding protein/surface adhesin
MSEIPARHDEHGASAGIADGHGAETIVGPHGAATDHGDDHGHDDHAHATEALGPIDWPMWGAGVLGVVLALAIAAAFVASTGFSFSA